MWKKIIKISIMIRILFSLAEFLYSIFWIIQTTIGLPWSIPVKFLQYIVYPKIWNCFSKNLIHFIHVIWIIVFVPNRKKKIILKCKLVDANSIENVWKHIKLDLREKNMDN